MCHVSRSRETEDKVLYQGKGDIATTGPRVTDALSFVLTNEEAQIMATDQSWARKHKAEHHYLRVGKLRVKGSLRPLNALGQ